MLANSEFYEDLKETFEMMDKNKPFIILLSNGELKVLPEYIWEWRSYGLRVKTEDGVYIFSWIMITGFIIPTTKSDILEELEGVSNKLKDLNNLIGDKND